MLVRKRYFMVLFWSDLSSDSPKLSLFHPCAQQVRVESRTLSGFFVSFHAYQEEATSSRKIVQNCSTISWQVPGLILRWVLNFVTQVLSEKRSSKDRNLGRNGRHVRTIFESLKYLPYFPRGLPATTTWTFNKSYKMLLKVLLKFGSVL